MLGPWPERLIHKLDAFTPDRLAAKEDIQSRTWALYGDLKAYGTGPTPEVKAELSQRFDTIFSARTCFATLNGLLNRLKSHKSKLLVVLDRPGTPLNTNGSENDIRTPLTRPARSRAAPGQTTAATAAIPSSA